jgi:hypothetical protein
VSEHTITPEAHFVGALAVNVEVSDGHRISQPFPVTVDVKAVVAVEEALSDISIYPNPTSGKIVLANMASPIQHVSVVDNLGKERRAISPAEISNGNVIDISELPSGIYFLKINTLRNFGTVKVFKR